jgi:hypothetical protein
MSLVYYRCGLKYTDDWEMDTIPEHVLKSEWARRTRAKVKNAGGGRPKTMRRCRWCKHKFGAVEMRKHLPLCDRRSVNKTKKKATRRKA